MDTVSNENLYELGLKLKYQGEMLRRQGEELLRQAGRATDSDVTFEEIADALEQDFIHKTTKNLKKLEKRPGFHAVASAYNAMLSDTN